MLRRPGCRSRRGGATASPPSHATTISARSSAGVAPPTVTSTLPSGENSESEPVHPNGRVPRAQRHVRYEAERQRRPPGRERRPPLPARRRPPLPDLRVRRRFPGSEPSHRHGRPIRRQLRGETHAAQRRIGFPADDAAQQRCHQGRGREELVGDRLVEGLVERSGQQLRVSPQAPVEGHLLHRVHEVEARPRTPVSVLAPRHVPRHEWPYRSHVVLEGVIQFALRGEHVRAPVGRDPVAREVGQRRPRARLVEQAERGRRGGPHGQVVVRAAVREDSEGMMSRFLEPVRLIQGRPRAGSEFPRPARDRGVAHAFGQRHRPLERRHPDPAR